MFNYARSIYATNILSVTSKLCFIAFRVATERWIPLQWPEEYNNKYTPLMSINEAKFYLTARTRSKHLPMHHVDCDPSGSDRHMLLAFLFPTEEYREVTRERRARGDASKGRGEGGKGGWGFVLSFYLRPSRSRVLASLALFTTRKGKLARRLICYWDKTLSIYLPHLPPFTTLRRSPLSHAATSIAHLFG